MKFRNLLIAGLVTLGASGCTDLAEELNGDISRDVVEELLTENADVSALLGAVYNDMRLPYQDQSRFWAAQEHTSDEVIGPTRGPDWDDNGKWRVLHNHTWTADHPDLNATFNELLQIVYKTTNILSFSPSAAQAADARFIRAFAMTSVLDGWGQLPFRPLGSSLSDDPIVYTGAEAVDFIISDIEAIKGDLPVSGPGFASQDAANALLMKLYLNKGAFANRAAPTFAGADMTKVVELADGLINSGRYSLAAGSDGYFANFAPNNDQISTENIFTAINEGGSNSGNVRSRWFCGLHYNQNPSGWNGFATIGDFYDKFETNDPRIGGVDYNGQVATSGIKVGFLVGQQQDETGTDLEDRKGNMLSFTKEVKLREDGDNLEVTGIRVIKYPIDHASGDNSDNDYVYLRYADVMLMKAEAILRGGSSSDNAMDIVNDIRTTRGADALTGTLSLDILIDERGRELYWEGHRRQDLIRFGKFLSAWNEKGVSDESKLLFAIPNAALAVNPNLSQNPGY
jgi:hypothetical protein